MGIAIDIVVESHKCQLSYTRGRKREVCKCRAKKSSVYGEGFRTIVQGDRRSPDIVALPLTASHHVVLEKISSELVELAASAPHDPEAEASAAPSGFKWDRQCSASVESCAGLSSS